MLNIILVNETMNSLKAKVPSSSYKGKGYLLVKRAHTGDQPCGAPILRFFTYKMGQGYT